MEGSLYWYIGSLRKITNRYITALTTKQVAMKVLFPPCLTEHTPLSPIDDSAKESAKIKQVLQENEYQESFISKIFKRITNNHSLSESQKQTQATDIQKEEIRISITLP